MRIFFHQTFALIIFIIFRFLFICLCMFVLLKYFIYHPYYCDCMVLFIKVYMNVSGKFGRQDIHINVYTDKIVLRSRCKIVITHKHTDSSIL